MRSLHKTHHFCWLPNVSVSMLKLHLNKESPSSFPTVQFSSAAWGYRACLTVKVGSAEVEKCWICLWSACSVISVLTWVLFLCVMWMWVLDEIIWIFLFVFSFCLFCFVFVGFLQWTCSYWDVQYWPKYWQSSSLDWLIEYCTHSHWHWLKTIILFNK